MSNKIKDKISAFAVVLSLVLSSFSSVTSPILADSTTNIETSLTIRSVSAPVVRVAWEMNADKIDGKYLGTDDDMASGPQFEPTVQYNGEKDIAICAIVTDPDGLSDLTSISAQIFFPTTVALDAAGQQGCGNLNNGGALSKLNAVDAEQLFCDKIRTNNDGLPSFNPVPSLTGYDDYCGASGRLTLSTAAIYCADASLYLVHPAGEYSAVFTARDSVSLVGTMTNQFTFQAMTAYETDFTKVNYGEIGLNTDKTVSGDLIWDADDAGAASIRNIGNTRLDIAVTQTDMGLGKTNGDWNVLFGSKIGSSTVLSNFYPEVATTIARTINPNDIDEVDFSISVFDIPPIHEGNSYTGNMTLNALSHDYYSCS